MTSLSSLNLKQSLDGLKSKKFSSVELTRDCLDAIKQKDKDLKAFVTVDETKALEAAQLADTARSKGTDMPLLGVPLSLKDNFLTKGLRTTASSKVLDSFIPPFDSTVSKKLKDAGAVIIGKNNMDAWAHGSSTETSDYGPTHNPHDITKLPGGSSGGTAAAVAADEIIAGIGSETAGSIRQPASWCGVIGFKPTYGRVSRYGVVAMESSLDSPGPITKTIEDSAYLLSVIAGHDPLDATTPSIEVPDYASALTTNIKGLRIGLPKEYFLTDAQPGINDLVYKAAKQLESCGAILIDVSLMDPKFGIADYTIIQRAGVSSNLSRFDGVRYGNDRTCFGKEAKRRIMLGSYALSSGYYDAYYLRAQKVRNLLKQDFENMFTKVDCVFAPTAPSTALPIGSSLNQSMFGELSDLLIEGSSLAGLTAVNIPVGFIGGLPVGAQVIAGQFKEQTVFNVGYAYEQAINWKTINYEQ